MPLENGTFLVNRYYIEEEIGQGGYGAVYRAYDGVLLKECAIKENLDTSPEAQRQFEREARILAPLRHPNLPQVFDHFTIPTQGQYLVMDYIEGRSLAEWLSQNAQRPSETQALNWINQVCTALIYLHGQNPPIIHRDIKPENIIITPDDRAVLVDFGISKMHQHGQQTTMGARRITPGFAPPEQYSGSVRTDPRSDIYSLGATLYVLLTGRRPPEAIDRMTDNIPLPQPRLLNPAVSQRVEQAVIKALDTATTGRFQNVAEFQKALTGEVKVNPPKKPLTDSFPKVNIQPNRWLIGLSVAAVALILLMFGGAIALSNWIVSGSINPTATPMSQIGPPPQTATPTLPPTNIPARPTNAIGPSPTALALVLPTATFSPTPWPTPTLTPTPSPTPLGQNCSREVGAVFSDVWQNRRALIGCPTGPQVIIPTIAEQWFQGGHLFWRNDTDLVYIVFDRDAQSGQDLLAGEWLVNPTWKWDGSNPDGVGLNSPPGLQEPRRGFGWLWRTHLGGPQGRLGWALDREYGWDNIGVAQPFERGVLFKGSDPKIYVLVNDGRFFATR